MASIDKCLFATYMRRCSGIDSCPDSLGSASPAPCTRRGSSPRGPPRTPWQSPRPASQREQAWLQDQVTLIQDDSLMQEIALKKASLVFKFFRVKHLKICQVLKAPSLVSQPFNRKFASLDKSLKFYDK